MPKYEIEQYELHAQTYRVEASTEAEAIAKLFQGKAEPVDGGLEFVEIAEDYGLPADDHRQLADQLRAIGVPMCEAVIPSIRSILKVE